LKITDKEDTMRPAIRKALALFIITLSFAAAWMTAGCSGSDADKTVRETIEEVTGKKVIEGGEKMKQQINALTEGEIEKVQQDIRNGTYGQEQEAENK